MNRFLKNFGWFDCSYEGIFFFSGALEKCYLWVYVMMMTILTCLSRIYGGSSCPANGMMKEMHTLISREFVSLM